MKYFSRIIFIITISFLAFQTSAEEAAEEGPRKDGYDYVALSYTVLDFHGINDGNSAKNIASTFTIGTYITDYVKVETRFGKGFTDDDLKGDSTIEVDWWATWFMGLNYPFTDWSSAYGLLGMSYVDGNATDGEHNENKELSDDFLASKFSMSWLLGLDFLIVDDWYAVLEIGRLHRGTKSDIDINQYSLGLKYEF